MYLKSWILVLVFLSIAVNAWSAPRILLVGDSWAAQLGSNNTFETVLSNEGITDVSVVKLGDGGSSAAQWVANLGGELDGITSVLNDNPSIDIVHINLGGNDLLPLLAGISTEQELRDAFGPIFDDVETVITHILSVRPTARIAACSYDYIATALFNWIHPILVDMAVARIGQNPNVFFMNAVGWVHYNFGYPDEFGPGEVPAPGGFPDYDPKAGGDSLLPAALGLHDGGIHLVAESYQGYIERAFSECYLAWVLEDQGGSTVQVDFSHIGKESGTPSEPMNDITFASILVDPGGTLLISGDSSKTTTIETGVFSKAMILTAVNGAVQIGVSGEGPPSDVASPKSGFSGRTK